MSDDDVSEKSIPHAGWVFGARCPDGNLVLQGAPVDLPLGAEALVLVASPDQTHSLIRNSRLNCGAGSICLLVQVQEAPLEAPLGGFSDLLSPGRETAGSNIRIQSLGHSERDLPQDVSLEVEQLCTGESLVGTKVIAAFKCRVIKGGIVIPTLGIVFFGWGGHSRLGIVN